MPKRKHSNLDILLVADKIIDKNLKSTIDNTYPVGTFGNFMLQNLLVHSHKIPKTNYVEGAGVVDILSNYIYK